MQGYRRFPVHLKIGRAVVDARVADARNAMLNLFDLVSENVEGAYLD